MALPVDGVLALLPSWREPLPVLARELVAVAGASHPTKGLDRGRCLICASGATVASVDRLPLIWWRCLSMAGREPLP